MKHKPCTRLRITSLPRVIRRVRAHCVKILEKNEEPSRNGKLDPSGPESVAKRFFQEVKGWFYFLHDQINIPKKLSSAWKEASLVLSGRQLLKKRKRA